MEDLAEAGADVAVTLEGLRESEDRGQKAPEVGLVVRDVMAVGAEPCQEAHAGGIADALGAIGAPETCSLGREPIDMRRADEPDAITAELGTEVVDGDQHDVGAVGPGPDLAGAKRGPDESGGGGSGGESDEISSVQLNRHSAPLHVGHNMKVVRPCQSRQAPAGSGLPRGPMLPVPPGNGRNLKKNSLE